MDIKVTNSVGYSKKFIKLGNIKSKDCKVNEIEKKSLNKQVRTVKW